MSWMDWGSRPKKSAATPPPLYLVGGAEQVRYCHSCGRVIGSRKAQSAKANSSQVKFCSEKCKRHKLRPGDRRMEAAFSTLLDGADASRFAAVPGETDTDGVVTQSEKSPPPPPPAKQQDGGKKKKVKGDPRIIVSCSQVEALIFGLREDPEKIFGRKKNRARRGVPDGDVWKSVDMEEGGSDTDPGSVASLTDPESFTGVHEAGSMEGGVPLVVEDNKGIKAGRVRLPQSESEVNGSIGGEKGWAEKIEETPEMLLKRREGQRRAEERESVRCAARRAVVFGLLRHDVDVVGEGKKDADEKQERRLCEAVMNGAVVEPSYAKGDWGIRWREM